LRNKQDTRTSHNVHTGTKQDFGTRKKLTYKNKQDAGTGQNVARDTAISQDTGTR
jgi:hypothetical protein